ncbi:MAG: sugar phosphate nucleotidyltransferase [Candidatus Kapaibacteriales bacterium]
MRAIIPVAGLGTRLRPHTHNTPKVLLNIAGKPILAHILDELIKQGCDKATIITGYLGNMVEEYVKNHYSIEVDFVEQEEMLGLGHAIWCAKDTFDDDLMIILGDTIFDADLSLALKSGKNSLGVKYVDDPRRFGVVVKEGDKVQKLVEKPDPPISNLAIVGIYYIKDYSMMAKSLSYIIDNNIKTKNEYQLTDALQNMISNGAEFDTFDVEGWHDCGKQETVLATNRFLLDRRDKQQSRDTSNLSNSVVVEPSYIGKGATIKNSVIGPYATVAEDSNISNCVLSDTIIGAGANVENIVIQGSLVGSKASLSNSVAVLSIGDNSEVKLG